MQINGIRRVSFVELRRALVPGFMLVAALLPAASLLYFRLVPSAAYLPASPVTRGLLIVVPLSTFLLAIFLGQARHRIRLLQAKEAKALHSAGIDPLSKLPNRLFFDALLETAMARATVDRPIALFAIDIDRFKTVNDTYGHQAGDQLILGVAERIRRIIRDRDCLARVGGDEFALMLADVTSVGQCAAMAHRIHDAMLAPFEIGDMEAFVTLSAGIALSPQDGETRSILMGASDLALYRAKHEGRNRFAFFDKTMEQKLQLGMTIEDDLRAAIKSDALTILYQPQMSGCGTKLCGVEALVRWNHPELGEMSPEAFIPLAESRGLIAPLGEWVLRRACRDARRWPSLRIAVNVSPVQFRNRGFAEMVKSIIAESGIEAQRLELELTEGVLIQDAEQAESVIMDLRAQGIRMGLDDFGSGYSSMIYLRRFAFDKIKIDKALLESMETSGEGAIILDSIISLGHALGLTVTAEGVEQKDQVDFLRRLGCDELQGFYFSPPLAADQIDTWVTQDLRRRESALKAQESLSAA